MIFHLIPGGLRGDCIKDLYWTGVGTRQYVEHDWVNGLSAQALKNFEEAGNVWEDEARDRG